MATASITPTRLTDTLSVTAISAGANYGGTENVIFNSAVGGTVQADGDLTGDGVADLLAVGGQDSLPSGLWLSAGQAGVGRTTGDGSLVGSMSDLGINGSGIDTTGPTGLGSPADYNGATAFSGQFTGSGLNDVLVYYPSGVHAGVAEVLNGNGDGSALAIAGGSTTTNALYDPFEASTPNNPVQLANAGCTSGVSVAGQGATCALPDLIGTSDDESGNKTDALTLYPSLGSIADFGRTQLSNPSPDGSGDWASWTLSTVQLPVSGGGSSTAMFLWDKATGVLDLWEGLALSQDASGNPDLVYTSYPVATGWNTGAVLSLRAADINGDGTPDLWATTSGGTTTAYLFSALSTTGAAAVSTTGSALAADSHSWPLTDAASGDTSASGTVAADASGGLTLTGDAGATWHTGDLFSPDVSLNGSSGVLAGSGPAVTTSKSFSVSAWVKPAAMNGGVVLSQDGTYGSGFLVYPTAAGWNFCMETGDAAGYAYNCAVAGTAQVGSWSHVTVTYDPVSSYMSLYVNGIEVGSATHTAVAGYTDGFQVGDQLYKGAHGSYFDGQVAQVETWNQTLTPGQVAALSNTTGSFVFPADNTLYPSGSQWTSGANSLSFNEGLMSVSVAGLRCTRWVPRTRRAR
ncbi:LamG domain-containing protein [Streptacidiphilus sp. P02-A3a]|uniref:LamG domain-containing protein n=1 Tax=Streptacidiphilus sp. P02-A3a TaxID=2704468 RepID=UPI0015FA49EB|nr:LamG domain-containing protein [Streptacidiphilus sp. P02-A3a]QMU70474.1 LamG domain-containing protein [Streptacidiphilus sp. P02-A3a]